jgi:hypothetical protein
MKLLMALCLASCIAITVQAQHFKLSATQGLAYDNNKKSDSLFFAKSYNVTQLRVGYHYGKLGLISNISYINQIDNKDSLPLDERVPLFVQQAPRKYANAQTLQTALGLELCVPVIKRKAQLNFYIAYGLSFSKSDSVVFYEATLINYSHKANGNIAGCLQTGFSFNYKWNTHFALKWQNEIDNYQLPNNAVDIRKIPATFTANQRKTLLVSSVGVQYVF